MRRHEVVGGDALEDLPLRLGQPGALRELRAALVEEIGQPLQPADRLVHVRWSAPSSRPIVNTCQQSSARAPAGGSPGRRFFLTDRGPGVVSRTLQPGVFIGLARAARRPNGGESRRHDEEGNAQVSRARAACGHGRSCRRGGGRRAVAVHADLHQQQQSGRARSGHGDHAQPRAGDVGELRRRRAAAPSRRASSRSSPSTATAVSASAGVRVAVRRLHDGLHRDGAGRLCADGRHPPGR